MSPLVLLRRLGHLEHLQRAQQIAIFSYFAEPSKKPRLQSARYPARDFASSPSPSTNVASVSLAQQIFPSKISGQRLLSTGSSDTGSHKHPGISVCQAFYSPFTFLQHHHPLLGAHAMASKSKSVSSSLSTDLIRRFWGGGGGGVVCLMLDLFTSGCLEFEVFELWVFFGSGRVF